MTDPSKPARIIPKDNTARPWAGCKKKDRRFAPFYPAKSAGQPKMYCSGIEPRLLAYVAVFLFVIPHCAARLRPKDAINGSVVIASFRQALLQLGDSGLAAVTILTVLRLVFSAVSVAVAII